MQIVIASRLSRQGQAFHKTRPAEMLARPVSYVSALRLHLDEQSSSAAVDELSSCCCGRNLVKLGMILLIFIAGLSLQSGCDGRS